MTTPFSWIDDEQSLAQACSRAAVAEAVAIDTECVRERTYLPEPSLVQMAFERDVFLIDLTVISNFQPLCELILNPAVTKVIHAAGQDHLILKQLGCTMEMPVFDTQIAAAFLGMGFQIGYKALVEECLGTSLEKGYARSDWLQRPLSAEQQEYAVSDVLHLPEVYQALDEKLAEENKRDWFVSESERILQAHQRAAELNPEEMSIKISGSGRLRKASQHEKLRALAVWRERKAQSANLPRRWLLSDQHLIELARLETPSAEKISELIKTGSRSKPLEKWGEELSAILSGVDDDDRPVAKTEPSARQKKSIDKILNALRASADEHNMDVSLIANRRQITRLVIQNDREVHSLLNNGWRQKVIKNHWPLS